MIHLYLTAASGGESETAHKLLSDVLGEKYGISQPQLSYGPQGKPFLPGGPHFSISHSRGQVALAVSDAPLGLDVEVVRPFLEKLPQRIFSPQELRWFQARFSTQVDFFTLWTLKESYYKYTGTGILGFPNGTDFYQDEQRQWHLDGQKLWFHVLEEKKLLLTLCCQKKQEIRIHRIGS